MPIGAPSLRCTMVAVAGKVRSGVVVADDDQVDVGRRAAGGGQRLRRRPWRRSDVVSPSRRFVALADAGALADPGVGGVDDLGQVVVGDDSRGQIVAHAGDDATKDRAHALVLSRGLGRAVARASRRSWSSGCGRSAATKSLAREVGRQADGGGESARVGAAVAFDYNPVQSEERPAVDRAGVELLAPCVAAPAEAIRAPSRASGPDVERRAQLGAEDSGPGPRRSSAPHCR